jgi:dTMP kinase
LSTQFINQGILISFEGLDASGKNTQSKMFCDYLKRNNQSFELLSFPDYSTPIGHEIRNYLAEKREYSPETLHMLYSANRYEFKSSIQRWIADNRLVVLNRYCESNIVYGIADGLPRVWLEQLEGRMPQADYVFYLKISPEVSLARKVSRDRFEANLKFLERVSQIYDAMSEDPRWIVLDGGRDEAIIHYEIVKTFSAVIQERSKNTRPTDSRVISKKMG